MKWMLHVILTCINYQFIINDQLPEREICTREEKKVRLVRE